MTAIARLCAALLLALVLDSNAMADDAIAALHVVPISTANNAAAWTVAAQGLTGPAQQVVVNSAYISLATNGDGTGHLFSDGFNNETWNGVWSATYSFSLPADATGISFQLNNLEADDKIAVALNGQLIPGAEYVVTNGLDSGVFNFGSGDNFYIFHGFYPPLPIQSGFHAGAINSFTIYVNNTGSQAPSAHSRPMIAGVDGSVATFDGELSYVSAVPEPNGAILFICGLLVLGLGRRTRDILRSGHAKGRAIVLAAASFLLPTFAGAVQIEFSSTGLGGNLYRLDYSIANDGPAGSAAISIVDILFDPALFDENSLRDASSPAATAAWSTQIFQSAPGVWAAFDMQSSDGIGPGTLARGFAVQVAFLGQGAPGSQPFEIYDPATFDLTGTGFTAAVPEPTTWASLALGLVVLVGRSGCRLREPSAAAPCEG